MPRTDLSRRANAVRRREGRAAARMGKNCYRRGGGAGHAGAIRSAPRCAAAAWFVN
jgi:hypothetical protein